MSDLPKIRSINDQLTLDDRQALTMVNIVAKYNCKTIFNNQANRIKYFISRLKILDLNSFDYLIVI